MSSNEILDASFGACRKLGGPLLQLTLAPTALCLAAVAFLFAYVIPALNFTKDPGSFAVQASEILGLMLLGLVVGGPLVIIGLATSSAIAVQLTSGLMMGRPLDKEAALDAVRQNLALILRLTLRELFIASLGIVIGGAITLFGGYLSTVTTSDTVTAGLVAAVGILGLFLGFAVFLQVMATHSLAIPAALVEKLGPTAAAKRSKQLLKGSALVPSGIRTIWSLYFVLFFVMIALVLGISIALELMHIGELGPKLFPGSLIGQLWATIWDLTPVFVILWAVIPAWGVTTTMLYYERRIRLEGFDIEALASEISTRGRTNRFEI